MLLYIGAPLLCLQLFVLFCCLKAATDRIVDFRVYYAAGRIVHQGDGRHLYNYEKQRVAQGPGNVDILNMRFMAPPFAALLFVPLTSLGFVPAYLVFLLVNLILIVAAALRVSPWLTSLSERAGPVPLIFFTFFPVGMALGQGQPTIIVLTLYCFAYASLMSADALWAGVLVSFALIKFQIALPVVLLFLLWRQWRFITGFSIGAAALGVVSLATLKINQPSLLQSSLKGLPHTFMRAVSELNGFHPQSMPNLYGLSYLLTGPRAALAVSLVLSVLLILWAARRPASLPLALLVGLLVSHHLYIHDLAPAILPLALITNWLIIRQHLSHSTGAAANRWVARCYWVSVGLLFASPLLVLAMGIGGLPLVTIPLTVITFAAADMSKSDCAMVVEPSPNAYALPT